MHLAIGFLPAVPAADQVLMYLVSHLSPSLFSWSTTAAWDLGKKRIHLVLPTGNAGVQSSRSLLLHETNPIIGSSELL